MQSQSLTVVSKYQISRHVTSFGSFGTPLGTPPSNQRAENLSDGFPPKNRGMAEPAAGDSKYPRVTEEDGVKPQSGRRDNRLIQAIVRHSDVSVTLNLA